MSAGPSEASNAGDTPAGGARTFLRSRVCGRWDDCKLQRAVSECGYAQRVTGATPPPVADRVPAGYSDRLSLLIHRLSLELLGRVAEGLAELRLNDRQYIALAVLAADEPGSQHELGKLMGLAPQLVVALTDSLEDLGLVTRRTNPEDRRRTLVELTREGRRALAHADELTAQTEEMLFATIGDQDRDRLHDILRRAFAATCSNRPERGEP